MTTPSQEREAFKSGNEFLPYHPQASHVRPDYRDGWNACYAAARSQAAPEAVAPQAVAALLRTLDMQHGNCMRGADKTDSDKYSAGIVKGFGDALHIVREWAAARAALKGAAAVPASHESVTVSRQYIREQVAKDMAPTYAAFAAHTAQPVPQDASGCLACVTMDEDGPQAWALRRLKNKHPDCAVECQQAVDYGVWPEHSCSPVCVWLSREGSEPKAETRQRLGAEPAEPAHEVTRPNDGTTGSAQPVPAAPGQQPDTEKP